MSNQTRQNYAHAYKVWLAENRGALNPKPEPLVPVGMTIDEAKKIRERAATELGVS